MKVFLTLLLSFLFGSAFRGLDIDFDRVLVCIALAENTPNHIEGKAGERSRYQITRDVWEKYTSEPFERASSSYPEDMALQTHVAKQHLLYLATNVKNPSVFRIAAAWNAGLTAVNEGRTPIDSINFADRVRNLYEEDKT